MPTYRMHGALVHIKMTNTKKRPAPLPCVAHVEPGQASGAVRNNSRNISCRCMAISSYLCDWALEDGRTCDAPLCEDHAQAIGPDRHLCGPHFAMHGAEQQRLAE